MAYSFDGVAKTVTLSSPTSSLTFTTNDLYSRAVDWVQSGDGAGYIFPFETVGGEPIGSGQSAGFFLFLGQGWTIIIPSGIDTVTVQGNLFRDPDDLTANPLFTNNAGALVNTQQSVVALGYSTGGGTFSSSDRALLSSANTQATTAASNSGTLESRLTAERATNLDAIPTIADDTAALARGDIEVDSDTNTLTLRKPDGTILITYNLTDADDVATLVGALQRTAQ